MRVLEPTPFFEETMYTTYLQADYETGKCFIIFPLELIETLGWDADTELEIEETTYVDDYYEVDGLVIKVKQ